MADKQMANTPLNTWLLQLHALNHHDSTNQWHHHSSKKNYGKSQ
jgi:hypothetical protein